MTIVATETETLDDSGSPPEVGSLGERVVRVIFWKTSGVFVSGTDSDDGIGSVPYGYREGCVWIPSGLRQVSVE